MTGPSAPPGSTQVRAGAEPTRAQAWLLDGAGGARGVLLSEVDASAESGTVLVLGHRDDAALRSWCAGASWLASEERAQLFRETGRPSAARAGSDAVLLSVPGGILFDAREDEEREIIEAGSVRVWADARRLVSVYPSGVPPPALEDVLQELRAASGPRDGAELLVHMAQRSALHEDLALMRLDAAVANAEQREEDAEPGAFDDAVTLRARLLALRRRAVARREAAEGLRGLGLPWMRQTDGALRELQREELSILDRIDALIDRVQAMRDRITQRTSAATNRVLNVITVLTALFTPLGFVTGVLGMNVGLGQGSLPGLASPARLPWVLAALAALALCETLLVRRLMRGGSRRS